MEVVDLTVGFEALRDNHFARTVRQKLRKRRRGRADGVEIEVDSTGRLIPVFYDIYRAWVDRWISRSGLPPHLPASRPSAGTVEKFETVAAMMGDRLPGVRRLAQRAAGRSRITLVHGEHAIGWRSYSIKELAGAGGGEHLHPGRRPPADACHSGCRYFDLGQCGGVSTCRATRTPSAPRRVRSSTCGSSRRC